MNLRFALRLLSFLLLGPLGFAASPAKPLWTCGMHPQIIKTEPGNCPICGMKLTPIRANASGERKIKYYQSTMIPGEVSQKPGKDSMGMDMVPVYEGSDTNQIQIDAVTVQRMNLKTGLVTRGPVRREIRAVGSVAYDEQGLRDITTKYEGWIEKLFVNETWTNVKAGDPLFEIYSPELYNAELNYLVARRGEGESGGPLTRAALGRLQLFDIPSETIAELAKTGQAPRTFVFRAPSDGVVIEKMAVVGQMMKPGERVYRLADLSSVWVLAQIYEQDLAFVHPGQTAMVRVTYGTDRTFTGRIELLLPEVQEQTRAATARIVLPNPDATLRPGMFVDVRVEAQLADSAILVPEMAVLRSGERNTVFVARDGGTFEPREVKLGARAAGGNYEVLSGLSAGERVVTSGQFMLDSESQLREAIQKMTKSDSDTGTGAAATADRGPAGMPAAANRGPADVAVVAERGPASTRPATTSAASALRDLALASADAAAALGADDVATYEKQRSVLNAALTTYLATDPDAARGPLGSFKDGLPAPADLAAARRDFEPVSTAIADLARAAHLPHSANLHIFECPMAPATGKARWVQRTAGTRNPFYGSAMPTCGDELP